MRCCAGLVIGETPLGDPLRRLETALYLSGPERFHIELLRRASELLAPGRPAPPASLAAARPTLAALSGMPRIILPARENLSLIHISEPQRPY